MSAASEQFFVAYGHCLLAGSGTRVAPVTTLLGMKIAQPLTGEGIHRGLRRGDYADAFEVFAEGLRHFPTSAGLLYGVSVAMQVSTSLRSTCLLSCLLRQRINSSTGVAIRTCGVSLVLGR